VGQRTARPAARGPLPRLRSRCGGRRASARLGRAQERPERGRGLRPDRHLPGGQSLSDPARLAAVALPPSRSGARPRRRPAHDGQRCPGRRRRDALAVGRAATRHLQRARAGRVAAGRHGPGPPGGRAPGDDARGGVPGPFRAGSRDPGGRRRRDARGRRRLRGHRLRPARRGVAGARRRTTGSARHAAGGPADRGRPLGGGRRRDRLHEPRQHLESPPLHPEQALGEPGRRCTRRLRRRAGRGGGGAGARGAGDRRRAGRPGRHRGRVADAARCPAGGACRATGPQRYAWDIRMPEYLALVDRRVPRS